MEAVRGTEYAPPSRKGEFVSRERLRRGEKGEGETVEQIPYKDSSGGEEGRGGGVNRRSHKLPGKFS